jgi:hypothetical protein
MCSIFFVYLVRAMIQAVYNWPYCPFERSEHFLNGVIRNAIAINGRVKISLHPDIDRCPSPILKRFPIEEPDFPSIVCKSELIALRDVVIPMRKVVAQCGCSQSC